MTDAKGRADLHIHSLASDGTAGVRRDPRARREPGRPRRHRDHRPRADRLGGRGAEIARERGLRTSRSSSARRSRPAAATCWRLFLERAGPAAARSLRSTIAAIHEQGGLAIPAHPLVPYPLCAQGWSSSAGSSPIPIPRSIPTGSRHSTRRRSAGRATAGLPRSPPSTAWPGSATATPTPLGAIGRATPPSRADSAEDLRAAILGRQTRWHGVVPRRPAASSATFGRQLRKYGRDVRDEVGGRVRRDGTGRDHGYPGGRRRPPRSTTRPASAPAERRGRAMKIGLVTPYVYPCRAG